MHRRQSGEVCALDLFTSNCRGSETLMAAFPFSREAAVGLAEAYIAKRCKQQ